MDTTTAIAKTHPVSLSSWDAVIVRLPSSESRTARFASSVGKGDCGHRASPGSRRVGVTPPVLYDHFSSKRELHQRLIARHYAELRDVWSRNATTDEPTSSWMPRAIDAWFAYVEAHPYAGRMLFRDTTGDPQIEAAHREIQRKSRAALLPLMPATSGPHSSTANDDLIAEMAWEVLRAALQGLALWWYEHPEVPREHVVTTAMNTIWTGFDRFFAGE